MVGIALLAAPVAAQAQAQAREALLVNAAWAAEHVTDPDLVVLHVGRQADYDEGHIQGARLVGLNDISLRRGENNLEMPEPDALRATLASLGVSDGSRILVYFGGSNFVTSATRVVLTLDYAGLGERTTLLDGGLDAWKAAGHPLSTETPARTGGQLSPLTLKPVVVEAEWVRERLDSPAFAVVDGRAAAFYDGVQVGGGRETPHKTGHIAGAGSVPFNAVFDDDLFLLSSDQLRTMFSEAGVEAGDTVIGYCHIGQQATAMLFAARSLGYRVVLYDGSFEDWSRHADYPVASGR